MDEEGDEVVIDHVEENDEEDEDYVILGGKEPPELEAVRKQVRDTTSLSSMFRKELETYLGDLDHKMDSEGRHLVSVPKNFDEIVGAMTREDLLSDDPKQGKKAWFSTLLEEEAEHDMDKQFGGRYHGILSNAPDAKVRHGMAEIVMLDRQLQVLNSKARALEKSSGDEDDSRTVESTSDTPRSRTFITKGPSRGELSARQKLTKPAKSPRRTSPSTPSPTKGEPAIAEGASLTEKESTRIEELLSMDDDEFGKFYTYLPDDFVNESKAVDSALEQYQRLDRLYTPNEDSPPNADDGKKAKARRANYLAQQRQERMEREKELTIDDLLSSCRRTYADYSGLIADESARGRGRTAANLLDVPAYHDTNATAPITRADIHHLLQNIAEQLQQEGTSENSSPTYPSPSNSISSSGAMVSQETIQQLVQQYRLEIDKLKDLRAAVQLNAQLSSAPSSESGRGASREGGRQHRGHGDRPGSRSSGGTTGYRDRLRQAIEDDLDNSHLESNPTERSTDQPSVDQVFSADDLQALRAVFLHNAEKMSHAHSSSFDASSVRSTRAVETGNVRDEPPARLQLRGRQSAAGPSASTIDEEEEADSLPPIVDSARSEHLFILPSSRRVHSREGDGEGRRLAKRPTKVVI